MAQLSITRDRSPAQLILRCSQDPYDPEDPLHVSAQSLSLAGSQLGAGSIDLYDVEQDLATDLIVATFEVWRWGASQQQLLTTMRYWQRRAREHGAKHRGP